MPEKTNAAHAAGAATTRGLAMIQLLEFIRLRHGDAGIKRLLDQFSPEEQLYLAKKIAPVTRVPAAVFAKVYLAIKDLFGRGDGAYYAEAFEWVGEACLNSFMKVFLKLGTPAFVAHNAPAIWRHFFSVGRMEKIAGTARSVELLISGHEAYGESICYAVTGFGRMAIKLSGGKNLRVNHAECIFKGKSRCFFKVEWD
jgi:hypothetical protein